MSKSLRSRPEEPPLSVTVTMAVMRSEYAFNPERRHDIPVPPPNATIDGPALGSVDLIVHLLEYGVQVLEAAGLPQVSKGLAVAAQTDDSLHDPDVLPVLAGRGQDHEEEVHGLTIGGEPVDAGRGPAEHSPQLDDVGALLQVWDRHAVADSGRGLTLPRDDRSHHRFHGLLGKVLGSGKTLEELGDDPVLKKPLNAYWRSNYFEYKKF